jgi:hypothetical protein
MKGEPQMRTLLAVLVSMAATHAYPQAIEADLDGNASALVASELQPKPQPPQPRKKVAQQRQPDRRVAALATRKQ